MAKEASKAMRRRVMSQEYDFYKTVFTGNGIDIGCGDDSVFKFKSQFPAMSSVRQWDLDNGDSDAQYMKEISDETYDFIHSSHSLEHMNNYIEALSNWCRILRPGGNLILTIPDEEMYEKNKWPSIFNGDHKWHFYWKIPTIDNISNRVDVNFLINYLSNKHGMLCRKKSRITDNWDSKDITDQTDKKDIDVECAIELIFKKKEIEP